VPPHPPVASADDYLIVVIALVVLWAITSVMAFVIVIRDERKMSPEMLERAWPAVTRDWVLSGFVAAPGVIVPAFGVLLHYIRTRRSWLGAAQGLLAAVITLLPALVVDLVLEALFSGSFEAVFPDT